MSSVRKLYGQGRVTVILCTYNRCQDLAVALESIACSQMPDSICWEVLAVDNNSTDTTRDVIESFCRRYPGRFRYLCEPKAGKSHALNAGIANARGDVLAFTDDDVIVEPTWLCNLTRALCDGDYVGSAGRILPAQSFTSPRWMSSEDFASLVCGRFDLGDYPRELDLRQAPYGANMAFCRVMFEKYGGFRTNLGPGPNRVPNGDTEFGRRLMRAHERLRYEPSAIVYHPVSQERITKSYFLSYWFEYGRARTLEIGDRPKVWGFPRDCLSLLRFAAKMPVLTLRWMFSITAQTRFRNKCWVWHAAGWTVGLYRRVLAVPRNSRFSNASQIQKS